MLSRGVLSQEQLLQALSQQRQAGVGLMGEWLNKMGFAQEQEVAAALAMQWSCPLLRKMPDWTNLCGVPATLLFAFRMVPVHLSRATGVLYVAFADEIAYPALLSIEHMLQIKTAACLAYKGELDAALARFDRSKRPTEKLLENSSEPEEIVRTISGYADKLCAAEVRVTACGNYFWARILGSAGPLDLIFSRKKDYSCHTADDE